MVANVCTLILLLSAAPQPPVDFDTEVLPVLAKAGCNAGACHGAAAGRGGFKLSLFGGDPAADHRAIVRELEGRRVNLAHPERSLLLLKPTWQLDHEGGERFATDSDFARVLARWIAEGATRKPTRQLTKLVVEPANTVIDALPAEVSLAVTAHFNDGTTRRIEHLATYVAADPASAIVSDQGRIEIVRAGRHAIVVRYLTQVLAIQITAAFPAKPLVVADLPRSNWIDDEINATLAALRLPPAPLAGDAALLRRITLDLTGRLPAPERVREYLTNRDSNKFAVEVERLLASREFTDHWTYRLADWLRVAGGPNDATGRQVYYAWLREQVERQRPLSELVAELLTAEGDSHSAGPPNFQRSAGDARGQAEHVAETLLAVRLRCANCHNHPLDRWTQDDYHGLAAVFARLDRGQIVRLGARGEVVHPVTGEAAVPRVPGERFLDPRPDGRQALASWLTAKDNPYFARAWANRLWESMFGRGLVHPADDLRDTNPASHPELLSRLADEFAARDFDLRQTLRLLALSSAYQRGSDTAAEVAAARDPDNRFHARGPTKPIPMPILLKVVCQATELQADKIDLPTRTLTTSSGKPVMVREPTVFDPLYLAGCTGQARSDKSDPLPESLAQLSAQLAWLNGPLLNAKLADKENEFARIAGSRLPTRQLIEEYYLRTLSRFPNSAELDFWREQIAGTTRGKSCEDFAWSLLSCPEFVTNH